MAKSKKSKPRPKGLAIMKKCIGKGKGRPKTR
jgi:hypothetical protein